MKLLWGILVSIVIMIALSAPGHSFGGELQAEKEAWSYRTTQFVTLTTLAAIDYSQSCEAFYGRTGYYEINPLLGKYPSRQDMLLFGGAGMGLLWIASKILPEKAAMVLLDSVVTSEQWNIEDNARVMVGQKRRIDAIPLIVTIRF